MAIDPHDCAREAREPMTRLCVHGRVNCDECRWIGGLPAEQIEVGAIPDAVPADAYPDFAIILRSVRMAMDGDMKGFEANMRFFAEKMQKRGADKRAEFLLNALDRKPQQAITIQECEAREPASSATSKKEGPIKAGDEIWVRPLPEHFRQRRKPPSYLLVTVKYVRESDGWFFAWGYGSLSIDGEGTRWWRR